MLWWRVIKLSILAIPVIWVTALEFQIRRAASFGRMITGFLYRLLVFIRLFYRQFFSEDFLNSKCVIVNYKDCRPIGTSLDGIVGFAWVCEKMKINVKIKNRNGMIWRHFENDNLISNKDTSTHKLQSVARKKFFGNDIAYFGHFFVSSKYGHKILSKLVINQNLERRANQWFVDNIKGNWVAIHYRGTDVARLKNTKCKQRYRMDLDPYITYLKGVVDNQFSIFAYSDQAQFINKMCIAFPGRVFSRDIERSYDESPIHRHDIIEKRKGIDHFNQEKDALIDLLILAKAKLIYTTGSGFVDAAQYFNPQTKIISLDQKRIGRGKNNMPIPRKGLYDRLCRPLK